MGSSETCGLVIGAQGLAKFVSALLGWAPLFLVLNKREADFDHRHTCDIPHGGVSYLPNVTYDPQSLCIGHCAKPNPPINGSLLDKDTPPPPLSLSFFRYEGCLRLLVLSLSLSCGLALS
ncbi:hypothetical protein CsSME_00042714 [Camellia sinensis var. sinensis]